MGSEALAVHGQARRAISLGHLKVLRSEVVRRQIKMRLIPQTGSTLGTQVTSDSLAETADHHHGFHDRSMTTRMARRRKKARRSGSRLPALHALFIRITESMSSPHRMQRNAGAPSVTSPPASSRSSLEHRSPWHREQFMRAPAVVRLTIGIGSTQYAFPNRVVSCD